MALAWPRPLLLALTCAAALAPATAPAQTDPTPAPPARLRVGVSPFPPFVVQDAAGPKGYSIDLWRAVARQLGQPFDFVPCAGARDKLDRLARGELDVAIGGLTVTPAREVEIDFTHPTMRSGLAILLPGVRAEPTLWTRLVYALGRSKSTVVVAFFLLVLVAGHLIWFLERGKDTFSDRYLPGVFEGVYWAVVTASTVGYGDKAPVKTAGRVLAMLLIVVSLPLFAYFTAELASAFTVIDTQSRVTTLADLEGRRVGVVRGTAGALYVARTGLETVPYDVVDHLYAALESGRVDAAVYDAPSVRYYATSAGRDRVHVAGPAFHVTNLAMATGAGSPLREQINRALLTLDEDGTLDDLRVKWLGSL